MKTPRTVTITCTTEVEVMADSDDAALEIVKALWDDGDATATSLDSPVFKVKRFTGTATGWSKADIHSQLDADGNDFTDFAADDISDADAQEWVNAELDLHSEHLDEDLYCDAVCELNYTLVKATLARLGIV